MTILLLLVILFVVLPVVLVRTSKLSSRLEDVAKRLEDTHDLRLLAQAERFSRETRTLDKRVSRLEAAVLGDIHAPAAASVRPAAVTAVVAPPRMPSTASLAAEPAVPAPPRPPIAIEKSARVAVSPAEAPVEAAALAVAVGGVRRRRPTSQHPYP